VDRRERALVLGPTHEDVVVDLVRRSVQSYRDLPLMLYQIQTKLRDEARPRGGLLRVREFIMKDLYSFDADWEGLDGSYERMYGAYTNIFRRCGVPTVPVAADSATLIKTIGLDTGLHPDFGSFKGYGIPTNTMAGTRPKLRVRFDYASESALSLIHIYPWRRACLHGGPCSSSTAG